ncbi:MAG: PilZ domain-containing protein [Candidatus Acidiferrales bacterium]
MKPSDRRFRQRFDLRIPLKIRNIDSPETPEQTVESSDISARGLYFSTDAPLDIGTRVEMFLTMPVEISGQDSRTWRCTGRVVRMQPAGPLESKSGNGIEILYYEVVDGLRADAATAVGRIKF